MSLLLTKLPVEPLTVEQEKHYAARIKKRSGDSEAINFLVTHTLREAVLYLRELSKHKVEDGELLSMAYKALQRSAKNFNPKHGKRFFYFCKKALRGVLTEYWRGLETVKRGHAIPWDTVPLFREQNKHPDIEDPETTAEIEGRTEFDYTPIDWAERWVDVERAMCVLTDFERAVILILKATGLSFREVGEELGCSRAWVGLTANRAIQKIRVELERDARNYFN